MASEIDHDAEHTAHARTFRPGAVVMAATVAILLLGSGRAHPGEAVLDHFFRVSQMMGEPTPIYMLLFDTTGDGRDEMFLAQEQKCGNGGCGWHVYSPVARGRLRYLGEAGFSAAGFRFDAAERALVYCWHMSAAECALGRYTFVGGRMNSQRSGSCRSSEPSCQEKLARLHEWQARFAPPLLQGSLPNEDPLRWVVTRGSLPAARMPHLEHLVVR